MPMAAQRCGLIHMSKAKQADRDQIVFDNLGQRG